MKLPFDTDLKYIRLFLIKILLLIQLCAIIIVPELLLLFYLTQQFGKFTIIALVLASSLLGLFIVTNSISAITHRIKRQLNNGSTFESEVSLLVLLMISGFFLIMPGLISSVFGILIYYTPLKIILRHFLYRKCTSLVHAIYYYIKMSS